MRITIVLLLCAASVSAEGLMPEGFRELALSIQKHYGRRHFEMSMRGTDILSPEIDREIYAFGYHVMEFQIHRRNRDGSHDEEADTVRGPTKDGVLVEIVVDTYEDAAEDPAENEGRFQINDREEYQMEYFRGIFISGGKNSPDGDWIDYKVNIKYNDETPEELVAALEERIREF